jgi:hypothetical protein
MSVVSRRAVVGEPRALRIVALLDGCFVELSYPMIKNVMEKGQNQ